MKSGMEILKVIFEKNKIIPTAIRA